MKREYQTDRAAPGSEHTSTTALTHSPCYEGCRTSAGKWNAKHMPILLGIKWDLLYLFFHTQHYWSVWTPPSRWPSVSSRVWTIGENRLCLPRKVFVLSWFVHFVITGPKLLFCWHSVNEDCSLPLSLFLWTFSKNPCVSIWVSWPELTELVLSAAHSAHILFGINSDPLLTQQIALCWVLHQIRRILQAMHLAWSRTKTGSC